MGHKGFEQTLYYIHLLPERLRSNTGIEWEKLESIYGWNASPFGVRMVRAFSVGNNKHLCQSNNKDEEKIC